jgi:hypothetical protein
MTVTAKPVSSEHTLSIDAANHRTNNAPETFDQLNLSHLAAAEEEDWNNKFPVKMNCRTP